MTIPDATRCPEPSVLQRFLNDELPREHVALVETHAENCTKCQELLEGLVLHGSVENLLRARAGSLFAPGRLERVAVATPVSTFLAPPPRARRRSTAESDLEPPTSIGGYRIVGELGRGSFGIVYRAHDEALDRTVAIKVPHAAIVRAVGGITMYLKEARTLALLDHPHVVRVHEAKVDERDSCFVVSQFVAGPSLADRLADGPLTPLEATRLLLPLAEALQHAHERGVYHRDVKPANVLLDRSGRPFLADFGLALNEDEIGLGPRDLGTPAYTSPEQARGEGHLVDGRTDVYSLGVVFYEMLTGKRPFMARYKRELLDLVANVDPPPARQRNRAVPAELDRICGRALARTLTDRYQSAGELADDLRAWLDSFPSDSTLRNGTSHETTIGERAPVDGPTGSSAATDESPRSAIEPTPSAAKVERPLARFRRSFTGRRLVSGAVVALVVLMLAMFSGWISPTAKRETAAATGGRDVMRIGIKPWVGYSPLVVARELGLVQGVDVEFVDVTSTSDVGRKVLSGELDFAPYLVDSHALARANAIPTRAILKLDESLTADAVVAREGIESFADLAGRSVAYIHHEAPHFLLLSLCDEHRMSIDDFESRLTETPQRAVDLFAAGEVDAVVIYEPFVQQALRRRPGSKRVASADDLPGSIVDIMTVRETYLLEHRPRVEALVAGWMRGLDLLERRDPRALAIACRFLGGEHGPVTVADYDAMVAGMRYGDTAANREFFRTDAHGDSEFRRQFNTAQRRWERYHQLSHRTDVRDGDASEVLLEVLDR